MDINRLNEFITLATHLNYSKAANQLYLTQPALSRHIHDLEQTIGAKLFVRDTHNVYLTSAGKLFFNEAKEIIDRYEHALASVRKLSASTTGEVKLGFLGAAVQPFLARFYHMFVEKHPQIRLNLYADDLDALITLLNKNELDCAFVSHVNHNYFSGLASETVLYDHMGIVAHPDHPFAKRDGIYFKELDGFPMLSFSKATSPITYDYHKSLFKRMGIDYHIVREVPNIETGLFFVSLNEGLFILPDHLHQMLNGMIFVPLLDESCVVDLNLIWKKENMNPSLPIFQKEFSDFLQDKL